MTSIYNYQVLDLLGEIASFQRSKLPKHGRPGSRVTIFPSRKNSAPVVCESLLEAAFCLELERRSDVLRYEPHPFTITINTDGTRYTPDFLVRFINGDERLIEIKNEHSVQVNAITGRIMRFIELFAEQGCLLEYLPAGRFYQKIKMQNLHYLYHGAYENHGEASLTIRAMLKQAPPIRRTISHLLENNIKPAAIAHALFYRHIQCNILKPISPISLVWS
ncbi:Tn7 transposase TnsA N-terminal domain-containing protein [Pseudomonas lini]